MSLSEGDLVSEVEGDIVKDGKVLVIRAVQVTYRLKIPAEHRETAEKVHSFHADFCPVARTLSNCVAIGTELRFV